MFLSKRFLTFCINIYILFGVSGGTLFIFMSYEALQDGRFGDQISVGARFSAPVQTRPGAHSASYTMGTGSFPVGKASGEWL